MTDTSSKAGLLSRDSEDTAQKQPLIPQRHRGQFSGLHLLSSSLLTAVVSSIIWAVVFATTRPSSISFNLGSGNSILKGHKFLDCGLNIEEALAKGCVYDILVNNFVHRLCYDEAAVQGYQQEGTSWIGYTDMNWTDAIPTNEAMGKSGVYWTNQRDHIVHCAFLWKKQFKALMENRRYIDQITLDPEHVEHCANFLMEMTEEKNFDWRNKPMTVEVGYTGCVDRGAWKQ